MILPLRITLLTLLLPFTQLAHAQKDAFLPVKDLPVLKTQILAAHKNSSTVKSKFTQEKVLGFMEDKVTSKGLLTMKKEAKMRIEYTSPFAYLVVSNGSKLTIKDGKKVTKIDTKSDKSFKQLNEILSQSMNGNIENIKGFDLQYLENKTTILLNLIPTESGLKDTFTKINIYLDRKTFQVNRLEMLEKSGDSTLMLFEETKINEPVEDREFEIR